MRKMQAILLTLALCAALSGLALAQGRRYYGNGGYNNGAASQWGYQDGVQAGQRDRSSGHSYRPYQWEAYKDADHGWSSSGYRSKDQYKQEYRQAFVDGYDQGFGRGGYYGNGDNRRYDGDGDRDDAYRGGYYGGGSASQWGYQDGLQAGQRDRSSGHSYRPNQWDSYKDADHGWSSSGYRSKGQYKQEYRRAFLNGYSQGYGNGGYYRR